MSVRKYHSIKSEQVKELSQKLKSSNSFASLNYSTLGVKSSHWLRKEVKKFDGEIKFVSNNVLRRALSTVVDSPIKLSGQNLVLIVNSEKIAPLKLFGELVRKYKLLKIGVVYCDKQLLTEEQKEYLPSWSEKEDAYAKLAYLLLSPILSLLFLLKSISEKQ
ncbi:50S ribosomal protein L10 [Mycoplasma wenyonii str. Massachusetts]|uniref:Large ribosomal subunit protein uL10 n=1 Tax=Mycoplasma wenyonii (strain Massachusetts) TaxID=1197325 RepID=I6ZIU7_MYCWM|nr:50S ribosomal protein L10 [Mycoplasma wenyonii]AFN65125.1 50S ribosomal protein L10 [Mycoplasma wenyonii str. Massachusetts]